MKKDRCKKLFTVFSTCVIAAFLNAPIVESVMPVVMWHGMGDNCCNPMSLGRIGVLIKNNLPGVYVKSIRIGKSDNQDTLNGFFKNANEQIEEACQTIRTDKKLSKGFNAIGFSQGGQFLRAVAQRCSDVNMTRLISVGGQHQGVYGFPQCPVSTPNEVKICDTVRNLLTLGAYEGFVQKTVVQAQYWHDSLNEKEYKAKSLFMADINQENFFNKTYKDNLIRLKKLVLVKFNNDSVVVPRESEWFGFFNPGQDKTLYKMEESPLYTSDKIGLKVLNNCRKIDQLAVDGDHLQFTDEWFKQNIVRKYLDN